MTEATRIVPRCIMGGQGSSYPDQWRNVCSRIEPDGMSSPHLPDLYDLARRLGRHVLASFDLPPEDVEDLIHELLAAKLSQIVAAESPSALFAVALRNRAISEGRQQKRLRHFDPSAGETGEGDPPPDALRPYRNEDDAILTIDQRRRYLELSPRDREILTAVAFGEDREQLARTYGISRAAVDQIVSRARRSRE